MAKWFGVPKLQGNKASILIGSEGGGSKELSLTLGEAEDLDFRVKQAIQLLKTGKIRYQQIKWKLNGCNHLALSKLQAITDNPLSPSLSGRLPYSTVSLCLPLKV